MKRKQPKQKTGQQTDFDKWLSAVDELTSSMVESVSHLDFEKRRMLGEILLSKCHRILIAREHRETIH